MSRGCSLLALPILLGLLLPGPARAERWRWPVRGAVVEGFHLPARPYGPGGHRGIDVAAAPGTPVRAACAGRVTFAGSVPGAERVVSVACGSLTATYVHLGGTAVRRGTHVRAGDRVGLVGEARHVHLGARRTVEQRGYVDPLALLGEAGSRPPVGPPPVRVRRRSPPAATPRNMPRAARESAPSAPLVAWVGAGLLVLAVPGVGVTRAARRRRKGSQAHPGRAPAPQ